MCPAAVAPERLSRELTRPAGFEHVAGRLRWPSNARGSRVTRITRPAGAEHASDPLRHGQDLRYALVVAAYRIVPVASARLAISA